MLFLKPSTSVIGTGDPIVRPDGVGRVDFEGELAVVVGKLVRRLQPADAIQAVLGFTCANDVTARDLQRADGQWTRAKGFDTFCRSAPGSRPTSTRRPGPGHPCQRRGQGRPGPPSWSTAWPGCWPSCPG